MGWPNSSFGFFCKVVRKKPNDFLANPISIFLKMKVYTNFCGQWGAIEDLRVKECHSEKPAGVSYVSLFPEPSFFPQSLFWTPK